MILHLQDIKAAEKQYYLQHLIAPRPICFASTISKTGNINLSPFSFFNLFSSQPPIVVFSPARRVRDNTVKHTLENVMEIPEVVIGIVTYDIVQQMSLSSCEYPRGTNEFEKSGLTPAPATLVQPPLIKECKANLECKVIEIKPLGENGGAGNLVICEVQIIHIDDSILDEHHKLDHHKIQHVARLGGDWYSVVNEQSLFRVEKPNTELGIGVDALPQTIRKSPYLSGNHLGQLANVTGLPPINPAFNDPHLKQIIQYYSVNPDEMEKELHLYAAKLLDQGQKEAAWQILLAGA